MQLEFLFKNNFLFQIFIQFQNIFNKILKKSSKEIIEELYQEWEQKLNQDDKLIQSNKLKIAIINKSNSMSKIVSIVTVLAFLMISISGLKIRILLNQQNTNKILTGAQMQSLNNVKLVVDGNNHYIYPEANNLFTIPNLSNGVHIVEAISNDYLFPVLIIDKRVQSSLKMKWLDPLNRKFIKAVNQPYLSPLQKIKYFQPEPSFPLLSFFMGGNGLFILMGIVMVFCYKGMNKLAEAQLAPNTQSPQQHAVSGNRNPRRA